jgi:uncharacterized protein YaiI (UPF0178 family)
MRVWIDADACPRAAKDLVVKFALKRQFEWCWWPGRARSSRASLCEADRGAQRPGRGR